MEDLESRDNWVTASKQVGGHLNALFFATQNSIELCRSYPDVLIMDCTYRTNRYNMPLLHIAAPSATHHYFSIAFCLLSGEGESDYEWALKQFRDLVRQDIKAPEVILTDDCRALKNALKTVFLQVL
jgi:hypothetical protein